MHGRTAAVLAACAGLILTGASVSTAEAKVTGWYDCFNGNFCTWRNADANSMSTSHSNHPGAPSTHYLVESNVITSYFNRGSQDAMLFDWNGRCYQLLARIGPGGWGNLPSTANDRTDVIKFGYASSLPGAC